MDGKAISAARSHAAAWERLADFLAANPDVAKLTSPPLHYFPYPLVYVGSQPDPAQAIADIARRAADAGARVEEYSSPECGGIYVYFGPVYLIVYTPAEKRLAKWAEDWQHRCAERAAADRAEDEKDGAPC